MSTILIRSICFLVLKCALWGVIASSAIGSISPQMVIKPEKNAVKTEEVFSVGIGIENAPPVYGTEFIIQYDPKVLEVIDSDADSEGIQIKAGRFFNLSQNHFELQNHVDPENGKIYYAVSMLNPSQESSGTGLLAEVIFQSKSASQGTGLEFINGKMGNREGMMIRPDIVASGAIAITDNIDVIGIKLWILGILFFFMIILPLLVFWIYKNKNIGNRFTRLLERIYKFITPDLSHRKKAMEAQTHPR